VPNGGSEVSLCARGFLGMMGGWDLRDLRGVRGMWGGDFEMG
jgi:hypothetical protein